MKRVHIAGLAGGVGVAAALLVPAPGPVSAQPLPCNQKGELRVCAYVNGNTVRGTGERIGGLKPKEIVSLKIVNAAGVTMDEKPSTEVSESGMAPGAYRVIFTLGNSGARVVESGVVWVAGKSTTTTTTQRTTPPSTAKAPATTKQPATTKPLATTNPAVPAPPMPASPAPKLVTPAKPANPAPKR